MEKTEGIMRKNLCPGALQHSMATYSSSVSGEQLLAWLMILLLESAVSGGLPKWTWKNDPCEHEHHVMGPCLSKHTTVAQLCFPCQQLGSCTADPVH